MYSYGGVRVPRFSLLFPCPRRTDYRASWNFRLATSLDRSRLAARPVGRSLSAGVMQHVASNRRSLIWRPREREGELDFPARARAMIGAHSPSR